MIYTWDVWAMNVNGNTSWVWAVRGPGLSMNIFKDTDGIIAKGAEPYWGECYSRRKATRITKRTAKAYAKGKMHGTVGEESK